MSNPSPEQYVSCFGNLLDLEPRLQVAALLAILIKQHKTIKRIRVRCGHCGDCAFAERPARVWRDALREIERERVRVIE